MTQEQKAAAWMTVEAGAEPDAALYDGDDPLAALAALTADDKINAP